jgi:hypothetical protein
MNNNYPKKVGRYEVKPVTIETVDQAVYDYFDKKLNVQVDSADGRKKVPVMFATGERWKLMREKKGVRDDNGSLILPLISIQRMDIDRTPGFGGMAQEVPHITVLKRVHGKSNLWQNLLRTRSQNGFPQIRKDKVVYEYLTLPFPDFATVYYQIVIWAQFTEQMNEILEKIFYKYDYMDSFVMPVEYDGTHPKGNGYYFVGFRDGNVSSQSNFEEFTDQERIIRHVYTIKTPAYFIMAPKDEPLTYENDRDKGKPVVHKIQSTIDIKTSESVVDLKDFEDESG